jgi:long-chain acyl-CoA synthetase
MVTAATADRLRAHPATLCDVIAGLDAHDNRTALIDFQGGQPAPLDYAALAERIARKALSLRALGIDRGSCVALWAPNGAEWVIAYFGAIRAGATVVPIDQQSMPTTAAEILAHATPALLLTTAAHRGELRALGREPKTLLIDPGADAGQKSEWPAPSADLQLPTIEPDDVAALLYTSGTTGKPKAVPLTHRNLASNAAALSLQRLIGADDRVLLPLPLHHTYPFTVGLVTALLKGAAVVFPAGISGPEITGAARDAEATALLAVPRLCEALWDSVRAAVEQRGERAKKLFYRMLGLSIAVRRATGARIGKRLFKPVHERLGNGLDLIGCGGAKLDPELAWRLEGLGWTVLTGYGLTETSPVLTFNDRSHARLGTEGRALPGVELDIRPVQAGEAERQPDAPASKRGRVEGEIVARGPGVFAGYHENPEANADAFTADGFFKTGDLGWLDRQGFLRVVGRSKELLVLADGKKVFPEALEKMYVGSKLLREVAILEDGGRLVALVVPDERAIRERGTIRQATLLREELEEVAARLPPHQRLTAFRVARSPLPRTQLGKLRRHLLPALYKQAASAEARPVSTEISDEDAKLLASERGRAAWQWLVARYPDKQITLDTSPQLELQIDSLEWVTLTTEIEQRFRVSLTGEAVSRILTLRDLIREIDTAPLVREGAPPAPPVEVELPGLPMRLVGAAIFGIVRPLMRLLFGVKVAGLENVAGDTPLVIVPNHASYLDPLALAAALPWRRLRRTYWAGWVGVLYTGPITRFVSRATQVMPVDPDRDLAAAIGTARALLQRGYSIVWFPEGRRSPTGEVGPFFGGIGQLLLDTRATALPTAISGTFDALPKQRRWPRLVPLGVTFGAPLQLSEPRGDGRAALGVSGRLERAVRALVTGKPDAREPTSGTKP